MTKLIEKQRTSSKVRKKYATHATRAALHQMDLAADIEARLGKIFTTVERIEEDRHEEMEGAGETHPQAGRRRGGLRYGFGRYRSPRLHSVHPCGKPCQNHSKEPKPNQASGVMNPSVTTHTLRCQLSLAQYASDESGSIV